MRASVARTDGNGKDGVSAVILISVLFSVCLAKELSFRRASLLHLTLADS